jgi:thymidine kinase
MSLELIIGPMFSGKSTELLSRIRKYRILKKKVKCVIHSSDIRYDANSISTHNREVETADIVDKLQSLNINDYDVIAIDEGQFYPDIYDAVIKMVTAGKIVIIAGLSGDFRMNFIGEIYKLYPYADNIAFQRALCVTCGDGTPASFTRRDIPNSKYVVIGGNETYSAVCRKHFSIE